MPFFRWSFPLFLVCGGALVVGARAHALPAASAQSKAQTAASPLELSGWNYQMADETLEARWSFRARQLSAKAGEARAVFGYKDARNFALLRATPTQIELWSIANGVARRLGQSANGSGELGLQIVGARVRVTRADALQIQANLKLPGQGFGLATRGGYAWDAGDVQPTEPVVFRDDFMRAQGPDDAEVPSQWRVRGDWKTSGALGPKSDAALNPNPFVFRASARGQSEAVARAGSWFWSDYAITASVRATQSDAGAPLVAALEAFGGDAGVRGEIDFGAHVARLKLGDVTLAQSAPFDTQTGQWHRVRLEPGPGVARLVVDGIERARAQNVPLAQGTVALRAQTGGANYVDFDDVRVAPPADKKGWGEGDLPERFQKDRLMKNWASAASAWARDARGTWWHTGDFFGASQVALPLPNLGAGAGLLVVLGADGNLASTRLRVAREGDKVTFGFEAGARNAQTKASLPLSQVTGKTLVVKSTPQGDKKVISEAFLNGKLVARQSDARILGATKIGVTPLVNGAPLPPPTPRRLELVSATFERDGRSVVGVNITSVTPEIARGVGLPNPYGAVVDNLEDQAPALQAGVQIGDVVVGANGQPVTDVESMRVAVGAVRPGHNVKLEILRAARDASGLSWEDARASTPNVLDYSFTSAPTDWHAARGRWRVAERWTCSPQWSFFSGQNSESPLLWSRFQTQGDWTLEAYLATPMDLARGERSPSDLNISVGGNGKDLASGYSFGFATDNRSRNTIWRGDEVALQKPFEAPPGAGETHQDWFYIRLEKRQIGTKVRFKWSVNGREIATYTDENPLSDGGHLAFWSANGGLSMARVRLWNAGIRAADDEPWTPAPVVKEIANALGKWSARGAGDEVSARLLPVAADKSAALQIVNPQSGGDWTTYVTRQSFSPALHPIVQWDYRMGAGVKLNLYAKIEGQWREIVWSGGASDGNKMGTIEAVTDGQWHRASFDLLAALREKGWGEKSVEALAFAAPGNAYLRAGLGGNHLGEKWELRDFSAPVLVAKTEAK